MNREALEEQWFRSLRERFLSVTRGRVPESVVEDVVQDALRIVHVKGISSGTELVDDRPRLAWCYQVLRNVIGNYYLKKRKRNRLLETNDPVTAGVFPSPAEACERGELGRLIREALALLSQEDGSCSRYLTSIAEGMKMGELADREEVEAAILYRRVYRCRARFRKILLKLGVSL
jgi:DNA-directed RNA polymerase specialized sigma24 family protein